MFFLHPDDLMGLDISNGGCYNKSIPQNLTFGYQGLPLGLSSTTSVNGSANTTGKGAAAPGADPKLGLTFLAFLGVLIFGWAL